MNIPLFYGVLVFLGVVYVWMGKVSATNLANGDDYFLMGRRLKFIPLSLSLFATILGGGSILGAAQEAFAKGWGVLFYPLGATMGLLFLGAGFGKKLRLLNIATIAEIFEKVYGSKMLRMVASALSITTLFIVLVAQGVASKTLLATIGISSSWVFFFLWGVLIIYTVVGGLTAVVKTDILQALFILAVLGFAFLVANAPSSSEVLYPVSNTLAFADVPWCRWLLMPLFFILIGQDIAQRCFAAEDPKMVSLSCITAGLLYFLCAFIAINFGVLARNMGVAPVGNGSVLIEAVKVLTTPWITSFFLIAIFAAVISSADSILCSISSNLYSDFLPLTKLPEATQVRISRLLTLAVGLFALFCTFFFSNIVSLLMLSYELSVSIFLVAILGAVWLKEPSYKGAACSFVGGAVGFILFRFVEMPLPKEVCTLLLSGAAFGAGTLLTTEEVVVAPQGSQ